MEYNEYRKEAISDLLAEMRADRWYEPSRKDLEPLLDDDQLLAIKRRTRKEVANQKRLMEEAGVTYWGQGEPRLKAYAVLWNHAVREERGILSRIESGMEGVDPDDLNKMLASTNAAGVTLEDKMFSWFGQLRDYREKLEREYGKLNEKERMCLTKPMPRPNRCSDYPRPDAASRGFFYPAETPVRQAVIDMLELELANMRGS